MEKRTSWFVEHQQDLVDANSSAKIAAEQATEDLGFTITEANMVKLFSEEETAIIQHQWPELKRKKHANVMSNHKDIATLAGYLIKLSNDLGQKVPEEIISIAKS